MVDEALAQFYGVANEYFTLRDKYWALLLSHPVAVKLLVPGRILVINYGKEVNKLGVLLNIDKKQATKLYSVLILREKSSKGISSSTSPQEEEASAEEKQLLRYVSLAAGGLEPSPLGAAAAAPDVIDVDAEQILHIAARTVTAEPLALGNMMPTVSSPCVQAMILRPRTETPVSSLP